MNLLRATSMLLEDDLADFPEDDSDSLNIREEPLWQTWAKRAGFDRVAGEGRYQYCYSFYRLEGLAHDIKLDYYCTICWVSAPIQKRATHPPVIVKLYTNGTRDPVIDRFNLNDYTYETFVQLKALHKASARNLKRMLSYPDGPAAIMHDDASLVQRFMQQFIDKEIEEKYPAIKPQ